MTTEQSPTATTLPKPRVLLIDDEPFILRALERLLKKNYLVEPCLDWQSAQARLAATADDPDFFSAILCDLSMPDVDGVDIYHQISQHYPHLLPRVAMVTGGAVNDKGHHFLQTHAVPTLLKPFDAATATALLQKLHA